MAILDFRPTHTKNICKGICNDFSNTVVYFDRKMVIYIYACGKCRTQFMLPMEKSVTFISACVNEIISSINRSFVYKVKERCHFRIVHNPTGLYIKSLYYTLSLFYCKYNIHSKWISHKHLHSPLKKCV